MVTGDMCNFPNRFMPRINPVAFWLELHVQTKIKLQKVKWDGLMRCRAPIRDIWKDPRNPWTKTEGRYMELFESWLRHPVPKKKFSSFPSGWIFSNGIIFASKLCDKFVWIISGCPCDSSGLNLKLRAERESVWKGVNIIHAIPWAIVIIRYMTNIQQVWTITIQQKHILHESARFQR